METSVNQLWHIYTMKYNPEMKIYKSKLHITIWINLTAIMLKKKPSCSGTYNVAILFLE